MAADERPGVWRQGQGIQGRNRRHDRGCHNGGAEIRQSWARGSVMTQQRGEMHRRGCARPAPNPNVSCWTTFARVFAVPVCSESTSVSESYGGTRLSFPSTDPGREVFQPNTVVGFRHGRASLPARRLRGPCPADRWSSRAPPPCSSRPSLPFSRQCGARIAFMAYLSSLTGMRRLAVAPSEWAGPSCRRPPREAAVGSHFGGVCLTFRAESASGEATSGRVGVRRPRDRTSRA
jgi:hypothetical protein